MDDASGIPPSDWKWGFTKVALICKSGKVQLLNLKCTWFQKENMDVRSTLCWDKKQCIPSLTQLFPTSSKLKSKQWTFTFFKSNQIRANKHRSLKSGHKKAKQWTPNPKISKKPYIYKGKNEENETQNKATLTWIQFHIINTHLCNCNLNLFFRLIKIGYEENKGLNSEYLTMRNRKRGRKKMNLV